MADAATKWRVGFRTSNTMSNWQLGITTIEWYTSSGAPLVATNVTLASPITSTTQTSVTVSSATALNVGTVFMIGSEQMYVSAKTDNVLTVTRGYNGTTKASSYATNTPIVTAIVSAPAVTALSAAVTTTNGTSISVSSNTGMTVGSVILVDSEQMTVSAVSGTTLTVSRGANSTAGALHNSGAIVSQITGNSYLYNETTYPLYYIVDGLTTTTCYLTSVNAPPTMVFVEFAFPTAVLPEVVKLRLSSTSSASTNTMMVTSSISPMVFNSTDNGLTWNAQSLNYFAIPTSDADYLIPATPSSPTYPFPPVSNYGGAGAIYGIVSEDGVALPNRPVFLFERDSFSRVGFTTTDVNGGYAFQGINDARQYMVMSYDPSGPPYKNALVQDRITPINARASISPVSAFWARRAKDTALGAVFSINNYLDGATYNYFQSNILGQSEDMIAPSTSYDGFNLVSGLNGPIDYTAGGQLKFLQAYRPSTSVIGTGVTVRCGAGILSGIYNTANYTENYTAFTFEYIVKMPSSTESSLIFTWGGTNDTSDNIVHNTNSSLYGATYGLPVGPTLECLNTGVINVRFALGAGNLSTVRAKWQVTPGTVHHIMVTYSQDNQIKLYIDGLIVPGVDDKYTVTTTASVPPYLTTVSSNTSYRPFKILATLASAIADTTTTTITVNDATGITPNTIFRIANNESIVVTAVSGNTLTVGRGVLGSTKATATSNTTLVSTHTVLASPTTLASQLQGATATATTISVNDTTNIVAGVYLLIDTETMLVTGVTGATVSVIRVNTSQPQHLSGATVYVLDGYLNKTNYYTYASTGLLVDYSLPVADTSMFTAGDLVVATWETVGVGNNTVAARVKTIDSSTSMTVTNVGDSLLTQAAAPTWQLTIPANAQVSKAFIASGTLYVASTVPIQIPTTATYSGAIPYITAGAALLTNSTPIESLIVSSTDPITSTAVTVGRPLGNSARSTWTTGTTLTVSSVAYTGTRSIPGAGRVFVAGQHNYFGSVFTGAYDTYISSSGGLSPAWAPTRRLTQLSIGGNFTTVTGAGPNLPPGYGGAVALAALYHRTFSATDVASFYDSYANYSTHTVLSSLSGYMAEVEADLPIIYFRMNETSSVRPTTLVGHKDYVAGYEGAPVFNQTGFVGGAGAVTTTSGGLCYVSGGGVVSSTFSVEFFYRPATGFATATQRFFLSRFLSDSQHVLLFR